MRLFRATLLVAGLLGVAAGPALAQDAAKGEKLYLRCKVCHTVEKDGPNKAGPNLHGIFGRKAGSVESFKLYSTAMKESGIVWDEAKIDAYIAKPKEFVPGNKMAFAGIPKPDERADLIAYLKQATAQ